MKNTKKIIALALTTIMSLATLGFSACNNGGGAIDIPESETTAYKVSALGDVFPIASYVGPTSRYYSTYDQCMVENLIREDVFKEISETGINIICGHHESDEDTILMLQYCAKYNMTYLPRIDLADYARWDSKLNKIVNYDEYTEAEKKEVDDNFRAFLRKWKDYDGFGGITAGDETGMLVTSGYKRMKEVFDEECPGMFFYLNMFGPGADGTGWCDFNPFEVQANAAGLQKDPNITWAKVMETYSSYVNLDVMSFDYYLFTRSENMGTYLFNHINQMKQALSEDKPIWYAVLNGEEHEMRGQSKEESYYQMNAPLAVGVSGLLLYPGFSPIENGKYVQYNLYDRKTGQPTYYMDWYKSIFGQIHASEKVLMNAAYKGTIATEGIGASNVAAENILTDFYRLKEVKSTYSQIVVGCYTWKGHEVLWVFNNATNINKKAQPNLIFNETLDCVLVKDGQQKVYQDKDNLRVFLNPGEAAMLVLGTDTLEL